MKEYKLSKGWAIFIYLATPPLIWLLAKLLFYPFQNGNYSPSATWVAIPFALGMITFLVLGIIDAYKGRLIIEDDKIIAIGVFSNRELAFNEIKGYTVNDKYIFVEPNTEDKKRIKISNYTGGYSEILLWLSQNFTDLDVQQAIAKEQEILEEDTVRGWSDEMREEKLAQAIKISKIINTAAVITVIWIFLYPKPYQISMLAAIIVPIAALVAVKVTKGLVRIDELKGSAYPNVIYAFFLPGCGIMLRAILDYDIFKYTNVWQLTLFITIAFLLLLLYKQKEITFKRKMDYVTVACLALFTFAYSFGAVIHLNCFYDNSAPHNFKAKVLEKTISKGKSTTYYVKLSTWGPQNKAESTSVSWSLYNRVNVGDEMNVSFKKGKLDIPWYEVTD